ncbi:MAG: glycosyltransferase family 2 protein [Acidimicrobiales bacterium]|nr:glycosyltransferase family 2 protein [Acidimicrobiales bacterium]
MPCRDEEGTVADVVAGFSAALPAATIYVYDNASADSTARRALEAGAVVRTEPTPGKGSVVRRMFADIDADVYVMVDGDSTYDASVAPLLLDRLIDDGLDMVIGTRSGVTADAGRRGHAVGNRLFNALYQLLFGAGVTDLFSGYRVFSRRYAKSFPAGFSGFEVETEMSVHAAQLRLPVGEVEVPYRPRPEGSTSKLRTVPDGLNVLRAMLMLLKANRPMALLGGISALFAMASVALGAPVVVDFVRIGLVERLPTAVLATGLAVLALVSLVSGVIMDSIAKARLEAKRLAYLAQPAKMTNTHG